MSYHYTDADGHHLEAIPEPHWDNEPVISLWVRGHYANVPVRIPLDRLEEFIAGIRDTARQAAARQEQHA